MLTLHPTPTPRIWAQRLALACHGHAGLHVMPDLMLNAMVIHNIPYARSRMPRSMPRALCRGPACMRYSMHDNPHVCTTINVHVQ
ncbi:hypothetical protein EWM64_g3413 [Hericium alpestre]|uniref:Uncharacterized protein n=1 Tax=Hericium alpestre TaxID=135208 RepID=A0A4Z0A3Z8_9AGAM|nr:hypothetical protein EWM64_g3413 [Hericium alpestre]